MTFDWCVNNRHDECAREYERFTIDPKTNKAVMTGEVVSCECPKRGCACYVKASERTKTKTRKRK